MRIAFPWLPLKDNCDLLPVQFLHLFLLILKKTFHKTKYFWGSWKTLQLLTQWRQQRRCKPGNSLDGLSNPQVSMDRITLTF